jgi:UPF0755 protein
MKVRRALALGALSLILLGSAAAVAHFYLFLQRPVLAAGESQIYEIRPGTSLRKIALGLERRGILRHSLYWLLLAQLEGKAHSIKAGEYQLGGPLTPQTLLDRLVAGSTRQFSLTLVEGWTFKQVMHAVAGHPAIKHTLRDDVGLMTRLGKPGVHPEGWFFPDTYHFPRGTTDLQFLRRSHEAMKEHLYQIWKTRDADLPLRMPYEALILASIVEKETALPDERSLVAAVLLSRLKKGMRLQTDPTVVYGLGNRYDGDIRGRDLRLDTPYNTYTRKGLPPTPIAMPGKAALEAAVHPAQTDALFFVAKRGGGHRFSATYEEHRRAVSAYQLGGKADYDEPQVE